MAKRKEGGAAWAFHATNAEVFDALAKRRHAGSLREHFGAQAFEELSALASAARRAKRPGGARVLIVPGMMGSRLCEVESGRGARSLWVDPLRISAGHLQRLSLPGASRIRAMGALLPAYARLKLQLTIAGFDARFFAYDWRLGIDELGASLAARIRARGKPVMLVAHSMGGLVARVASKHLPRRFVKRLIMLGTPNRGAFSPVLALRGTYPFVNRLARLDLAHTPEYLAGQVFCTFPGLYHMLPARASRGQIDLLDPASWPAAGPQPDAALLGAVAAARARMADADSRMCHIVGVNRKTVISVKRTPAGFEYGSRSSGDGTVPAALAMLPGLATYFADEAHGELANNPRIIAAVIELLRGGACGLPRRYTPRRDPITRFDDAQLRAAERGKVDWRRLDSGQREAVWADLDKGSDGAENSLPSLA